MKMKVPLNKHKTVMLIDDNEIDNFINEKIIKACLFAENVYVHTSSKSALEFFKNIASAQNQLPKDFLPSYIFLDINMPLLDGFHFLDEFEKFPDGFKKDIKVVMLTTSLNPSDVDKSAGYKSVAKFLHKPLTENELQNL